MRRPGLVGAVAIAEVGERTHEVPLVAPLRRQPGERCPQRLAGPGSVPLGDAAHRQMIGFLGTVLGAFGVAGPWVGAGPAGRF